MKNTDYIELIPELKEWEEHNGHPFTPDEWISCVGDYEHAIGYAELFWPEFHEYDGCVFVGSIPDIENYENWLKQTKGNKQSVEAVINHVHITDLFQAEQLSPSEAQIKYLGNKLKEMWLTKAKAEFPSKDISVEFNEGDENDLVEYQITLYQNDKKS